MTLERREFLTNMPRRKRKNPTETDWVPVHAIRRTADGGIQLLTEKGILSNPQRKKGFLKKVERLFSAGTRGVRKALGNPSYNLIYSANWDSKKDAESAKRHYLRHGYAKVTITKTGPKSHPYEVRVYEKVGA